MYIYIYSNFCESRTLKEAAMEHFGPPQKPLTATEQQTTRTFGSIRKARLRKVNKFMESIYRYPDGTKIGMYIRNSLGCAGLNGGFTDGCFLALIEMVDIKKLQIISPFIGALVYLGCAESHNCPVTTVFTDYVDIINSVYRRNLRQQVSRVGRDIRLFKTTAIGMFIAYQKSKMRTIKRHISDHVADDIDRKGSPFLLDADIYEY